MRHPAVRPGVPYIWLLHSPRYVPIDDTDPGQIVTIAVPIVAPKVQASAIAKFKMVDEDDLFCFPKTYSVGLALQVLVGH